MEGLVHLIEDYKLLRQFRWGHLTYFGCRYLGISTTICFLLLSCLGQKGRLTCQGLYLAAHITSSLLFLSSGAMFWIRAGFVCEWKKWVMIPLLLYGITISVFAMRLSFGDYKPGLDGSPIASSFVCSIESSTAGIDQAILRFLMASFDILTAVITFIFLYRRSPPQSWLKAILIRDQLIYVCATTFVYLALGMDLIFNKVIYLGVLCPSIISIICCRLFLRLKKEGSEYHHVIASNLLSLSQVSHQKEQQVVLEDQSLSPWYNQQSAACEIMLPSVTVAASPAATLYPSQSPDTVKRSSPPHRLSISMEETNEQTNVEHRESKRSQDAIASEKNR